MEYKYTEPVDMPRGTHYGSNYWLFNSVKCHKTVAAFSNLEYENLLSLEMNHEVEYFCPQPLKTPVVIDGKTSETVFDVYVVYKNETEEMQEVKYSSELEGDSKKAKRSQEQIIKQKAWCAQNGINYQIRTEKEIEAGEFFIRNLSILAAKNRRFCNAIVSEKALMAYVEDKVNPTIGMLKSSGLLTSSFGTDFLAHLYYQGKILFSDIENKPLTNSTEVTVNG